MNLKELIQKMLSAYFIIVTCTLAAVMVIGMLFDPNAKLEYRSLMSPFIYGLLGILPAVVMYSPHELSDRQMIIRKIIQLIVTEAEIMAYLILNPSIDTSEPKKVISLIVSILVVYVAANVIGLVNSYFTAQKLTKALGEFQRSQ